MKRALFLFLLTLTACQPKPTETTKQVLRLNMTEDAVSLDPRVVHRVKDLTLTRHLFEGLTRMDGNHKPQLALAKGYEISEDRHTYTFHLRHTEWSNGDALIADDFVYSWRRTLDPSFGSLCAHMLFPIKNAEEVHARHLGAEALGVYARDDHTLIVELVEPTPYFLELVAFPTFFPVNRNVDQNFPNWAAPPGKHFASSGPFFLEKWIPDQEIVLGKNPSYWDSSNVFLEKIDFSMIADNNTESLLFNQGQLDWLGQPLSNNISTELLGRLKEAHLLDSYLIAGTFWFTLNVDKEPFTNGKIRKAFALALSRAEIIEHILQGGQSAATSPIPPSLGLSETPYFQDGDTEEAAYLFEAALTEMGWTRETFPRVQLKFPPHERNRKIVQYVQQKWQETFHVPIDLVALEYQVHQAHKQQGNFQVCLGEWIADYFDPIAFLELFKYRNDSEFGTGMNHSNWVDPQYTALLDASIHEADPQLRKKLLQQAEQIIVEAMPIIPLYHYSFDYVKKDYVQGVVLSPLGSSDFKTARIQ